MIHDTSDSGYIFSRGSVLLIGDTYKAMYGRCPRCKSKSDFSAKRSGAAMYTASHDGISVKS
jgi:hypothetical protein